MKRHVLGLAMITAVILLVAALPGFSDRLRAGVSVEYGTASSYFGLASPNFSVPPQNNSSNDAIVSGKLEYLFGRRWPLEVGLAIKGSFAVSGWDLGSPLPPGVTVDGYNYYYPDDIHISADWWALAAMLTAHIHLGPIVTLDGAVGYGPYGYFAVNYWDDDGLVSGPVTEGSGVFPQNARGIDWSAGFSFGFFHVMSISLDAGVMGPDFVAGLGLDFSI